MNLFEGYVNLFEGYVNEEHNDSMNSLSEPANMNSLSEPVNTYHAPWIGSWPVAHIARKFKIIMAQAV